MRLMMSFRTTGVRTTVCHSCISGGWLGYSKAPGCNEPAFAGGEGFVR